MNFNSNSSLFTGIGISSSLEKNCQKQVKWGLPSSLHRLWTLEAQGNNLEYLPGPTKVLGCGRSERKCCCRLQTRAASPARRRQANLAPSGLLQESCTASRVRRRQPASSPRPGTSPSAPRGNWTRCASAAATPLFATGPGPRKGAAPPRPFGHGFPAPSCSSRQPFSRHTAEGRGRRQPLLHCSSGLPSPAPRDSSGCPFILGREGNLFF